MRFRSENIRRNMTVRPPLPAVDRDWSILSKLLLGFMHLANKINESLPRFGHALLWPISKLELPYCPGLAILQIQGKDSEVRRWRLLIMYRCKRGHREERGEGACKEQQEENKAMAAWEKK